MFDDLEIPTTRYGYHELSHSRLGWNANLRLSSKLLKRLEKRDLALPSEDGLSVPLHPFVRTTILVLLSQLAPQQGLHLGMELAPITNDRRRVLDLLSVLRRPQMPSTADVVALDVETVGVDLSSVPLEDVLAFREDHGAQYRAYVRNVRRYVRELSLLDPSEREVAMLERSEELADLASALRQHSRSYWRRPLGRVAFGGAGAALALSGNRAAGAVAAVAALLEWDPKEEVGGAFSYLFEAERSLVACALG